MVENVWLARETSRHNPAAEQAVASLGVEPTWIDHEGLKDMAARATLFVRTGEATPYANVVLGCGVPF